MEMIIRLLLLIVFIFLNGFFVASEFALISLRKTHIDELVHSGSKTAKLLAYAIEHLNQYISATQLGITIASLALGWIGEATIADIIAPLFAQLPQHLAFITVNGLATVTAFALVTYLTIVFGELAPKITALQRTVQVGFLVIRPLTLFTRLFLPAIWLLNESGNLVVKLFGLTAQTVERQIYSEREIKIITNSSAASGAIQKEEAELVYKALRLDDIAISEIMLHREKIRAIAAETKLKDVVTIITKDMRSRFPIYKDSIDHIVGFVHVKDIYKLLLTKNELTPLAETKIIRSIIFVPEKKKASEVLVEMRKRQVHMAIVQTPTGKVAGLVTMEDIFESLVGEIEDEF